MLDPAYGRNSKGNTTGGRKADTKIELHDASENEETPRYVTPPQASVDVFKLLTELEDIVEKSPKKLGFMFGFDEDKFNMTLLKIRASLPVEMKNASKLARESERLVEETRSQADQLVEQTRKQTSAEYEQTQQAIAKQREQAMNEIAIMRQGVQKELEKQKQESLEEIERHRRDVAFQADQLIAEARERAEDMIAASTVLQEAELRAQQTLQASQLEANSVRRGADDYARDVLTNMESVLGKAMGQVQRGRELLERG